LDGGTSLKECNGFLGSGRKGHGLRKKIVWAAMAIHGKQQL